MLSSNQSKIITDLIDYINKSYNARDIPNIVFDELSVKKDSICISTYQDSSPVEKVSDVIGSYVTGTLTLNIVYRVMSITSGNSDLDFIAIVDDIYNFIMSNYKLLQGDNYYIDKVSQISGAKLDTVYSGGVKDFRGIFEISYERKV